MRSQRENYPGRSWEPSARFTGKLEHYANQALDYVKLKLPGDGPHTNCEYLERSMLTFAMTLATSKPKMNIEGPGIPGRQRRHGVNKQSSRPCQKQYWHPCASHTPYRLQRLVIRPRSTTSKSELHQRKYQ